MRLKLVFIVFLLVSFAAAKDARQYQKGQLLRADSAECGNDEGEKSASAASGSAQEKAHALLCPEYLLMTDQVLYRIRPSSEKHAVRLPVGANAQFRMDRDKLQMRVEGLDHQERAYVVISTTPRHATLLQTNTRNRPNHLQ